MRYKLSQYQKMQQKMALTPQMRQSMQLLNMPIGELSEYIDSSVEKNPLLKKEFDKPLQKNNRDSALGANTDYSETVVAQDENPRLSLLSQARMLNLNGKALEITEHLIYEIDDNGYIRADMEEVAADFSVEIDEVEKALSIIQSMDPPGIGARDVRECLQLQLKRMDKEDSPEYAIVTSCINELATNDINKISRALNIDKSEALHAVKNIKKMNPRPASTMLSECAKSVIPDLIASVKNNKIRLGLNREWLPRLQLYNPYENKLGIIKDKEAREFFKKNMNAAKQLMDNLKRREETMCRVADYILISQQEHLEKDISRIKTLTIKDVAEALNLHPSTISRTVSNKHIQINDRVVPLKNLLSHCIKKQNGELVSKTYIKSKIRELVNNEDKARPLSDSVIKRELEQEGIVIKRRTVAKYRESLRILPIHLRKNKAF